MNTHLLFLPSVLCLNLLWTFRAKAQANTFGVVTVYNTDSAILRMQCFHVGRNVPRAMLLPLGRVDARLGTPRELPRVSTCLTI